MNADPRINEISKLLLQPESTEDVRAALVRIDELSGESNLWLHMAGLIRRAFGCLQELTAGQPDSAYSVLIDDLLPRCLRPDEGADPQRMPRYDFVFGEWLEVLTEVQRHQIRQVALPRAKTALDGTSGRNALRLIGSIGYWDDELLARLKHLIESHDDETGDLALSVRAWLAPVLELAPWLLTDLHRRMTRGPSLDTLTAASAIGTSQTAQVIWTRWLAPPSLPPVAGGKEHLFDLTLGLLSQIAERSHDSTLSAQVWSWFSDLARRFPDRVEVRFAFSSNLTSRLNCPGVVPDLVRRAGLAVGFNRYRYYLRLSECAHPAHLADWDTIPSAALAQVRLDATNPSAMTGSGSTIEFDQKQGAWEVLLSRGERSVLPPFVDALTGEVSGYVLSRLLDLAGCIALPQLPPVVAALLANDSAQEGWSEQEPLVAQVGAIRAAHGAANRPAFDALLGYRQIGPGVLLSVVDALAETAMIILKTGDRAAVSQLLTEAAQTAREDTRGAATGAVAQLLEEGLLTGEEVEIAASLAAAPATHAYARRSLLFAFASRPPSEVPETLLVYATNLLNQEMADDHKDPRPAALVLLARQPHARADVNFLAHNLGLKVNAGVVSATPGTLRGVAPHIVGRYFVEESERFGPAVAAILSEGSTAALSHLLPSVREVGTRCPAQVIGALIGRLCQADDGRSAELPVLRALAAIAPDRLLSDGCHKTDAWLPQARASLAEVLGRLSGLPDALTLPRFDLLMRLAGDGIYAVRRAAYRAAATCDPNRLVNLIQGWAKSGETGHEGLRRRAAECVGWLPLAVAESIRALGWDQEPGVRAAYSRSMTEREERARAYEYEERVLTVGDPDEVIRAWRYGVALSQVGDDSTLDRLAERLGCDLPPSVRFWLSRVRKAVERRWGEVTRQWPDPWFARPGHLETFTGTIRSTNGESAVTGTLWLIQAEIPGQLSSWGGWATGEGLIASVAELLIPGRRPSQVLISSSQIPAGNCVFSGNDRYPDPIS